MEEEESQKRDLILGGSLRRGLLVCSPLLTFGLEVERASPEEPKGSENSNVLLPSLDKPQEVGKIPAFPCTWKVAGTMEQRNDCMKYLERTAKLPTPQRGTDVA